MIIGFFFVILWKIKTKSSFLMQINYSINHIEAFPNCCHAVCAPYLSAMTYR